MEEPRHNTHAGWPASDGLSLYLEVSLSLDGEPDPGTGYLADIGDLDRCVRETLLPLLIDPLARQHAATGPCTVGSRALPRPATLLRALLRQAQQRFAVGRVRAEIALSPFLSISMSTPSTPAPEHVSRAQPDRAVLRQTYEFAASHRLHCPDLSAERNRELFGKCNNLNGHGHNYRLEVPVELAVDEHGVSTPTLHRIQEAVRRTVIDRFDHRHLNLDLPEFSAMNPSVENIAKVIHSLLSPALAAIGGTLRPITLWETEKTCCTYPVDSLVPHSTDRRDPP
jgi:6-pyruvoyl-tetrahydropterin synthase